MHAISTIEAPAPAGHYAQALVHDGWIYVSGQLPLHPVTGKLVDGEVEEQVRQAFENLSAILTAAGSDLAHVVRTTVYVPDVALWSRVNAVYAEVFGDHRPARTVVPTGKLHHGALVEVDAVAVVIPSQ